MDKGELKLRVCKTIDERREEIIALGDKIFKNPELGFKEEKTSALVKEVFDDLGLPYEDNLALTGVKALGKGKSHDTRVAIMGELDAVVCPLHPDADPLTGAAHSCGHNAQIASMLGAAIGLVAGDVLGHLDGDVAFMAVPAEEYVELEFRERLRDEGKIKFFGGKQELIRIGAFDDIDMAMMVHSHAGIADRKVLVSLDSSGFVGKTIRYTGKEAHAGAAPFDGVNALNAAMVGLMAIHAQRETFKDEDRIRVHPIITKGGDLVNIVPADVRMETYVRGRTIEAVVKASEKVNRALKAGAYALGAEVEINEIPGYLPLIQDPTLNRLFAENSREFVEDVLEGYEVMGATDAGDVSALIPTMHAASGGFVGNAHSKDFRICDPEIAYIIPAKAMAMTVVDLLFDGAQVAKEVKGEFTPAFENKESYLKFWEEFAKSSKFS
jgi:amidohydrolase